MDNQERAQMLERCRVMLDQATEWGCVETLTAMLLSDIGFDPRDTCGVFHSAQGLTEVRLRVRERGGAPATSRDKARDQRISKLVGVLRRWNKDAGA